MQEHISSFRLPKKSRAMSLKVLAASVGIWLTLQVIFPLLICLVLVASVAATPAHPETQR
jgi:uncharacterized oligopeptide transporter (OPT) family protein